MSDWITAKIQKELAEEIDEIRKGTKKSRSQFIYESVKEKITKESEESEKILKEILNNQKELEKYLRIILEEKGVVA